MCFQTLLHCALEESLEDQTGMYYEVSNFFWNTLYHVKMDTLYLLQDCSIAVPSFDAENVGDALELWKMTERVVGLS